jgi:LytTr DNA-binding domain
MTAPSNDHTAEFRRLDHARIDISALLRQTQVWQIICIAVVLFAVAGPFGLYAVLNFPARLAMWAIVGPFAFVTGIAAFFLVSAYFPAGLAGGLFPGAISALIASFPVTLAAMLLDQFFVSVPLTSSRFAVDFINLAPFVLALAYLLSRLPAARISAEARGAATGPSSMFIDKLKPEIGRRLLYISAQDHYLEVVTDAGRDLVLFRLSDAVAQLSGHDGAQIHRSHWVARRAVCGEERRAGKRLLVMPNGVRLPVSRTFAVNLKSWGKFGA